MRKQLLAVLAAATLTATAVPAHASPAKSTVNWGACPADVASPGLQCASLEVPLDYRHPDGKKISLAISRLPSTDPAKRRGVLLFNPGGPGEPGLAFPPTWARIGVPASLLAEYDLIGFDPRGVAHSTPVSCDLAPEQLAFTPKYAHNREEVVQASAAAKQIARQCAASASAAILPYVTTANTARDMDRIRAALGEQKISYFGLSYGTYLGGVYASLFPDQTDRVVLDSVVGPTGVDVTTARRFAEGMQDRFPDFAKWAAVRDSTYGLGSTPAEVTATFFKLADKLDQHPASGIDGSLFRLGTHSLTYQTLTFPRLAQTWQALLNDQPRPARCCRPPRGRNRASGRPCCRSCAATTPGPGRFRPTSGMSWRTGPLIRCSAARPRTSGRARPGRTSPSNQPCSSATRDRRTYCWSRTCATRRPHCPVPSRPVRRSATGPEWSLWTKAATASDSRT